MKTTIAYTPLIIIFYIFSISISYCRHQSQENIINNEKCENSELVIIRDQRKENFQK